MKINSERLPKKQSEPDPPSRNSRVVVVRPVTAAGQFVARRYRINPVLADMIADLAGLGSEVRS